MARKFIAGSTPDEAFQTVLKLRNRRLAFTADLLGEAVISEAEADVYQQTCLDLIRGLAGPLAAEPEDPLIDRDHDGPIPRVNLSLKLSSLTTRFDPIHRRGDHRHASPTGSGPILQTARELGAYVHVDMEQYAFQDLSYDMFRRVLAEPEFRDWSDVGIVVQAYLPDAEDDLADLRDWVEHRGTPITVRLVKGAYWDYEVPHRPAARLAGAGLPPEVAKRRQLRALHASSCSNIATRSGRPSAATTCGAWPTRSRRPRSSASPATAIELQTLHGMGDPIQDGAGRARAAGAGLHTLTARCCRAWRTWCAASWRTRRTNRS